METVIKHGESKAKDILCSPNVNGESHQYSNPFVSKVIISPGTDLNNPYPVPFQKRNGRESGKRFPSEVFTDLPELHRLLCARVTPAERDVLLVGLLGVVSGILPNVGGYYGGKQFGPNLFTYTLGPYGEGKSGLMWARKIAEGIHREKAQKAKELTVEYRRALAQYRKDAKMYEQGKISCLPEEPTPAPHLKLFIPANIGKTGMLQLIQENGGRGILFETEADTMVEAMKQDHGGFSDTLRQTFGHEPLSFFRRTNSEDVEIPAPALSVVLSSTLDQLPRLIPSAENGLFSRFLYYEFDSTPEFNDVFDKARDGYGKYFTEIGDQFKQLHDRLASLEGEIRFSLELRHEQEFLRFFKEQKSEIWEYVDAGLGGTVNRLGLICFRIAMQLSVCRAFSEGSIPYELRCSDIDFANALRMVRTFLRHTLSVYERLPRARPVLHDEALDRDSLKIEQKRLCFELFNGGVTNYREIAKIVLGAETYSTTVFRWIKASME